MSNEVTTFDAQNMLMNPQAMGAMNELSAVMSNGKVMVPDHLRGKPADCLAVIMQAARWKMDPFVDGVHVVKTNKFDLDELEKLENEINKK